MEKLNSVQPVLKTKKFSSSLKGCELVKDDLSIDKNEWELMIESVDASTTEF